MAPSFSAVEYSTEGDTHSKFNGLQYISFGKVLVELRDENHVIRAVQSKSLCPYSQPPKRQQFIYKMEPVNGIDRGNDAPCECQKECGTAAVNMNEVRVHGPQNFLETEGNTGIRST